MDKIAVVDFDKTLIKINSFPLWIIFVLLYSAILFDFKWEYLKLLISRKLLRNISHNQFKKELLCIELSEDYALIFSKILNLFKNKKTISLIKDLANNRTTIIITSAAPETYLYASVRGFLESIETNYIIGAHVFDNVYSSNYKEEKYINLLKKNILNCVDIIDYCITDSIDDKDLAMRSKKLYLVSPNKKSLREYSKEFKREIFLL